MKKFNDYFKAREEPTTAQTDTGPVIKSRFDIKKSNEDKMQAFGWASISIIENGDQIEDWQNDMIDPEDLENAAYEYVLNYRGNGEMHEPDKRIVGTIIESVVFTPEKMAAMSIPEGTLPIGWWIGVQVSDPEVWKKIKDGTYTMFSIEGTAERVPVKDEEQEEDPGSEPETDGTGT